MVISFIIAFYLEIVHVKLGYEPLPGHIGLIVGVSITSVCWLIVTLLTRPADDETLRGFYRLVRPGGPGWDTVLKKAQADNDPIDQTATKGDLPRGILCMVAGCLGTNLK